MTMSLSGYYHVFHICHMWYICTLFIYIDNKKRFGGDLGTYQSPSTLGPVSTTEATMEAWAH